MKPFICRGFEGTVCLYPAQLGWRAQIIIADVMVVGWGGTAAAAKARVRRKLDAVERAFRQRGFR